MKNNNNNKERHYEDNYARVGGPCLEDGASKDAVAELKDIQESIYCLIDYLVYVTRLVYLLSHSPI